MAVTKEMWFAYRAVQDAGYYNMLDPRALALANEMNDLDMTRQQWGFIQTNFKELKKTYE